MICPHCGREVRENAKFCGSCGVLLLERKENKFASGALAILKSISCIFILLFCQGVVVFGYEYSVMMKDAGSLVAAMSNPATYEQFMMNYVKKIIEQIYSHMAFISLIGGLLALLVICLILRLRKHTPAKTLRIQMIAPGKMFLFLLLGAALNLFVGGLISLIPFPEGVIEAYNETVSPLVMSDNMFIQIISIAVVTPIIEEIVFRGYAITRMKKAFGPLPAIIISAIIFGFSHYALNAASLISVAYATVLGLIFGFVFVKYDSLLPSIICHMAFNLINVFVPEDTTVQTVMFIAAIPIVAICFYIAYVSYPSFTDVALFPERFEGRNEAEKNVIEELKALRKSEKEIEREDVFRLEDEWNKAVGKKKSGTGEEKAQDDADASVSEDTDDTENKDTKDEE